MKEIRTFESTDGTRWANASDAYRRDRLDERVRVIEAMLPHVPSNPDDRIAVSERTVRQAKHDVVLLCREYWPTEKVFQDDPATVNIWGWGGRFISEVGGPVNRLWFTLSCMAEEDGRWFLYQQPFFALNQGEWHKQRPQVNR